MTNFQWLAGGLMLLLSAVEIVLQTRRLSRRSISNLRLSVWLSALFFILYPAATIKLANWLSIGRGTDLLVYVTVLSFIVSFFYIIHALERHREQLTSLVRQIAINSPYATPAEPHVDDDHGASPPMLKN